jgi:nicotinamide-nucleotide amidase
MFSKVLLTEAAATLEALKSHGMMCVTAESCTGGLIAGLLTALPGASEVVERGFVTYSNSSKTQMLGVSEALLNLNGAVSAACAEAMAQGALKASAADIAVSVTGVAGPGGGSVAKPVGLVYIGVATRKAAKVVECRFGDLGRDSVRERSILEALRLLREGAQSNPFT